MYQIKIDETSSGGFSVKVGCQPFFYLTAKAMVLDLEAYISDNSLAERKHKEFLQLRKDREEETPIVAEPVGVTAPTTEAGTAPHTFPMTSAAGQ